MRERQTQYAKFSLSDFKKGKTNIRHIHGKIKDDDDNK